MRFRASAVHDTPTNPVYHPYHLLISLHHVCITNRY